MKLICVGIFSSVIFSSFITTRTPVGRFIAISLITIWVIFLISDRADFLSKDECILQRRLPQSHGWGIMQSRITCPYRSIDSGWTSLVRFPLVLQSCGDIYAGGIIFGFLLLGMISVCLVWCNQFPLSITSLISWYYILDLLQSDCLYENERK